MNFYLTFGQNSPARNGYILIVAENYAVARKIVIKEYRKDWSMLYEEEDFNAEYFPSGKLRTIGAAKRGVL